MDDMYEWVPVERQNESVTFSITERMRIPQGWLYRTRTHATAWSIVFVPATY